MKPIELKEHKVAQKHLPSIPIFKSHKRKKLPEPFKRLGGKRIFSTELIDVSSDHVILMYWRDGEILTDRSFYAHLFCRLENGSLSPLFEFHWHPSHKGFHCKTPCNTTYDYTNRMLPGAKELSLKTDSRPDPKRAEDLSLLIMKFCHLCGISLPNSDEESRTLW